MTELPRTGLVWSLKASPTLPLLQQLLLGVLLSLAALLAARLQAAPLALGPLLAGSLANLRGRANSSVGEREALVADVLGLA